MRISWVFANSYQLDPGVDIEKIKSIGPTWGSWQSSSTDNIICHNLLKSKEFIQKSLHTQCNFFVPKDVFDSLGKPASVKVYDGKFDVDVFGIEDIVAMHLVSTLSDVVLMVGYQISKIKDSGNHQSTKRLLNYHGLLRSAIVNYSKTQWVVVDHPQPFDPAYQNLSNLTCDTMENVLQLLT